MTCGSLNPRLRASMMTLAYCHVMQVSSVRVSVMLLGKAVILVVGDDEVVEMSVDRDWQQVFQGLAMLLMGSMLKSDSREGSCR